MLLIGGVCWCLFALGFGVFLVKYICQGAGLQFFGPSISSGSVLMGLVHVVGLVTAAVLCFVVGAGLCARGIVPEKAGREPGDLLQHPPRPLVEQFMKSEHHGCKPHPAPAAMAEFWRSLHRAMIRLLSILAMSLLACCTAEAQSTNDEVHLRATVQDIVALTGFSGTVMAVDIDPRFALTVRIVSAVPAITNFTAGAVVTFAIHSPSRLFGAEATKGKTYEFSLRCKNEDGKLRFLSLELRKEQANRPPATRELSGLRHQF